MQSSGQLIRAEKSLEGLKDFQRRTVDYVFERLYGAEPTRRMLISDEVGLGKTMVARGLIARTMAHLWDKVDRLDVIYICSNQDIARQNMDRLGKVAEGDSSINASRLTLLASKIAGLGAPAISRRRPAGGNMKSPWAMPARQRRFQSSLLS